MNLQESIRRILREEIKKRFTRPDEKFNKIIYKWLDIYFGGSQIYKEEYWKYYGFRYKFCKNSREIADLRIEFDLVCRNRENFHFLQQQH